MVCNTDKPSMILDTWHFHLHVYNLQWLWTAPYFWRQCTYTHDKFYATKCSTLLHVQDIIIYIKIFQFQYNLQKDVNVI